VSEYFSIEIQHFVRNSLLDVRISKKTFEKRDCQHEEVLS
jgi:hypothetical protein